MITNDCTILLQGRISDECLKLWIDNYAHYKIVLSIWEDENISEYNIPDNWKVVINQYPLIRFKPEANLDYQIITTLKGLSKVDTKWVIKMRCDEYWSNIEKIYNKMKQSPEKIISGSMFFRKWGIYKFHPSDKILGGTLDNIFLMFESTLHNLETKIWDTKVPESQLGFGFVLAKEPTIDFQNIIICDYDKEHKFDPNRVTKVVSKGISVIISESSNSIFNQFSKANEYETDWENVFENLKRYRDIINTCIECVEPNISKKVFIEDKPYMQKWFDIIDVNELKPYIATSNKGEFRVWYRDDFDNQENNCLTSITD